MGGLLACMALPCSSSAAVSGPPAVPAAVPGQLIVGHEGGGRPKLVRVDPRTPSGLAALARKISRRPGIAYAEPNYYVHTDALPSDELFARYQWGLRNTGSFIWIDGDDKVERNSEAGADIDVDRAWELTTGTRNVVVAVVDTGVFADHEDLDSQIWSNPREAKNRKDDDGNGLVDDLRGWDFADDDADPDDESGHGTHVAGIVAGEANGRGTVGVAPGVRILPVRAVEREGTDVFTAAQGVYYAASMGADVVNMSFGTYGESAALTAAIRSFPGTLFVASAGNNSTDNDVPRLRYYPCSQAVPNLVCVAGSDPFDRRAARSSWGSDTVDVAAPGAAIMNADGRPSLRANGIHYRFYDGTSMAAAHVSGIAALMSSAAPWSGAADQRSCLRSGAERVPGLAGVVATGRVDAYNSLRACGDRVPPNVAPVPIWPRDGERVRPKGLTFRFLPGADALSGVVSNTVIVDGRPAASPGVASRARLRERPRLRDGRHFWVVRSADRFGNTRDSRSSVMYVDGTGPRLRVALRRNRRLTVRLGEKAIVAVYAVHGKRKVRVGRRKRLARGRHVVQAKLPRSLRRAARRGRVRLTVRAADALGNVSAKSVRARR